MDIIKTQNEYVKVRNLEKLLRPKLSSLKINVILRYLQRNGDIEVDLDGNIIWIRSREQTELMFAEKAIMSKEFANLVDQKSKEFNSN